MVHQCSGVGAESGHFRVPYDERTPLPCLAVCIGLSDCADIGKTVISYICNY